jgi:hypothetical protein
MYERRLKHNWSVRSKLATLAVWVAHCLPGLRHIWQPHCCIALLRSFGSLQPQLAFFTFFLLEIPLSVSILSHFHSMRLAMLMSPSKRSGTHLSPHIPVCPLGRYTFLYHSVFTLNFLERYFTFIHKCEVVHGCACA